MGLSEADGSHWLQAGSLKKGMLVLLASGVLSSVDTVYSYAANAPVYNFEIAEHHNYYVGKSGVLVHNGDCIVEFAKRVLAYEHGLTTAQVTTLINDVLTLPNGKNILHRIGKGEIHPKAYDVVKKHAPTKIGDEDILASITARAKKDNDLKLFDDLDNKNLFDAYLKIRNDPENAWKILKEISDEVTNALEKYAESKFLKAIRDAGKAFEKKIGDNLTPNSTLMGQVRHGLGSLSSGGSLVPADLTGFTQLTQVQINLGTGNYCVIDFAWVKNVGTKNNKPLYEVYLADAKLGTNTELSDMQKILKDKIKQKADLTVRSKSFGNALPKDAELTVKKAARINGPDTDVIVTKFE